MRIRRRVTPGTPVREEGIAVAQAPSGSKSQLGADATEQATSSVPVPVPVPLPVGDVSPDQFGVARAAGDVGSPLNPYVARDADADLDEAFRSDAHLVLVVAAPASGATRSVYESLLRTRPDARMLNTTTGRVDPEAFVSSDVDLVWIPDLGVIVRESPGFEEWIRDGPDEIGAMIVAIVREEDDELIARLDLSDARTIAMGRSLSPTEIERAGRLYRGERLDTIADVATAIPRYLRQPRARYAADSYESAALLTDDDDTLGIRADVDMLAALIASNQVVPPLSIGLFGQWGSGKSFLMHQIRLKISELAERSRAAAPDAPNVFCSEILPIEFNAWQYAGGDLWASLINRVFEGIRDHLGDDARYQAELGKIERQNAAVAEAQHDLKRASGDIERSKPAMKDRKVAEVAGSDPVLNDSAGTLKATINLDPARTQLSQLREEVDHLQRISRRLRKGWATSSARRRRAVTLASVVGLTLLVVAAIVPSVARADTALLGFAVPLITTVVALLEPVNRALAAGASLLGADEAERRDYTEALARKDRAAAKLADLRQQGLTGLYGFVAERHTAVDYREHLGLAPIIREDLKRLAALAEKKPDAPGIDRVVVFIDDLDRCAADQVVRVLEAVNLLFGFKLFVVVVAVDSRWLIRSLQAKFDAEFDGGAGLAPSPRNYLEKIIQIPFWLRPMQTAGFGRLVTTLVGELEADRVDAVRADESDVSPVGVVDPASPFHTPPVPTVPAQRTPAPPPQSTVESAPRAVIDLNPAALKLTADELVFLRRLAPLVSTPRAAKRLVNTYQLLRVSASDVETFLSDREYEPVLILLALMTGTAELDDEMATSLRQLGKTDLGAFLEHAGPAWAGLSAACAGLPTHRVTPELLADWLPRVARYSFHPTAL